MAFLRQALRSIAERGDQEDFTSVARARTTATEH
jgi:hypothetical protein